MLRVRLLWDEMAKNYGQVKSVGEFEKFADRLIEAQNVVGFDIN